MDHKEMWHGNHAPDRSLGLRHGDTELRNYGATEVDQVAITESDVFLDRCVICIRCSRVWPPVYLLWEFSDFCETWNVVLLIIVCCLASMDNILWFICIHSRDNCILWCFQSLVNWSFLIIDSTGTLVKFRRRLYLTQASYNLPHTV